MSTEKWTVGGTPPLTVLLLTDAAVPSYAPTAPRLAAAHDGGPELSLSLVLDREPTTADAALAPLITSAALSFGVTLSLTDAQKAQLAAAAPDGDAPGPVFGRAVTFTLARASGGEPLATAASVGSEAAGRISVSLGAADAVAVLGALDGAPSGLALRCDLTYRAADRARTVRVEGSWAALYDALAERARDGSVVDRGDVVTALADLIWSGAMRASIDGVDVPDAVGPADIAPIADAILPVARFFLTPGGHPPGETYVLGRRPSPAMPLQVTKTARHSDVGALSLEAALETVLGGALDGLDRGRYIIAVAGSDGHLAPMANRAAGGGATRSSRDPGGMPGMVAVSERIRALPLVLTPDSRLRPSAGALLASGVVRPVSVVGRIDTLGGDDITVMPIDPAMPPDGDGQPAPDLPVVAGGDPPLYAGGTPGTRWYAPVYDIVQPQPGADPGTSPFLFGFRQVGVTGGPDPRPALEGTIRFTLVPRMSDATRAALAGAPNPAPRQVGVQGLTVSLEVPFKDQATGQTRVDTLDARLDQHPDGTVVATVDVINEWVQLAYGALAYAGFQPQPARVNVSYAFRACQQLRISLPVFGGKVHRIPQLDGPAGRVDGMGFEARTLTLRLPTGSLALAPEPPSARAVPVAAPARLTAVAPLAISPEFNRLGGRPTWTVRSVVHTESHDLLVPCSTLGALYQQSTARGDTAVGCQDALRLGEIHYRQYEEIEGLRDPGYRVYRSLQQPGRYLVVPAAYRITRYGPQEPADRAYRPVLLVYGQIGEDPAANRYVLSASMQPDLPYFVRRALLAKLATLTPSTIPPVLVLPTDPALQAQVAPVWTVLPGMAAPQTVLSWDGLQVTVTADLATAQTLMAMMEHTGLGGTLTFTLPDGTVATSALSFDTQVTGPLDRGPVAVELSGTTATLTNRIEQPVAVTALMAAAGTAPATGVPVDATLAPAASRTVTVPAGTTDAFAAYAAPGGPVALREIDVFIEDVAAGVIFANLVNFANHGLKGLSVECRMHGSTALPPLVLDEDQHRSADVHLTLPITSYLEQRLLEYRVTKTPVTGNPSVTPWLTWNLATQGSIVNLTWEVIGA